jgi:ribosomal protein S18 acetylase RimI-like enzyme
LISSAVICDASVEDLDTIYEIERECFPQNAFDKSYYVALLLSPDAIFLKSCVDNDIAGFVVGLIRRQEEDTECVICTVNVRAEFRRVGIATALVRELEKRLIYRKCRRIIIQVHKDNQASIGLFSKLDYRTLRILKNYYHFLQDALEMEKILNSKRV